MTALTIAAIALIIYSIYLYLNSLHSYWKNKGVKGPKPTPFFGHLRPLLQQKESLVTLTENIYKEYPNEKVVGIYQGYVPTLVIRDPEIAKRVLIKDFNAFMNRGLQESTEPWRKHLFSADGNEWKIMRQKLSPIFTSGKLKNMMPLLNTCADQYMRYMNKLVKADSRREVQNLNMKYTIKAITSVVFGIDVNTFVEQKTSFELMAEELFTPNRLRRFCFILNNVLPGIVKFLHIQISPLINKFFQKLVREIVIDREGKPKVRKDFMDLLIELKEEGKLTQVKDTELEITDELIAAQALVFYAAGVETSSGVMSFLLYELSLNPEIQDKCYDEIKIVMKQYDCKLDFEALKELQYLAKVFQEALRKYPVASVVLRQSVTDFVFKDINLTIKKGTKVIIPLRSYHLDEKYYLKPEKFDPDRFLPENKENFNYDYYMPFGDGPRNCIGLRLAEVMLLLGLAHLLNKFRVTCYEKTPKKIVYDPAHITLTSIDGLWLNIEKREEFTTEFK